MASLLLRTAVALLAASAFVPVASAYLTPEEVLLQQEYLLPPGAGEESVERVQRQQEVSARRREREQELIFDAQRPAAPAEEEAAPAEPAPSTDELSTFDVELLRTLRLLERVESRQQLARFGGEPLHAGAPRPGLAPTGAGAILTALAMLGATVWTLRRARRKATGI